MSGVLRKRSHRLEPVSQTGITNSLFAASLVLFMLIALLAILGHFSPIR